MKKRSIIWGITFILAAILFLANHMGLLGNMGYLSLIISILLVPIIIINIINMDFFGIFFPLAIIGIIYSKPLGIEQLTPWPILIAAVLVSIGLSLIFPQKSKKHHNKYKCDDTETINLSQEHTISFETKFSGTTKYVNVCDMENIYVDCSFGGMKIYLNNADIKYDHAIINFSLNFSGVEVYIPRKWEVIDHVNCVMSGVKIVGTELKDTEKTITLTGDINFSGVTIIYI